MNPSLRDLRRAHAELTPAMTGERRRQFAAVLRELERAVSAGDVPDGPLTPEAVAAFLRGAEAGRYRSAPTGAGPTGRGASGPTPTGPGATGPTPTSDATNRTRVGCLNRLSERAGHPFALAHRTPAPAPKAGTTVEEAGRLREYLRSQNRRPLLDDDHARILAAIGLCLDTRGRSGELASIRLGDLAPDRSTLRLRLNPQRLVDRHVHLTQPLPLSAPTRAALDRYLPIRERLVAQLRAWHLEHPDQGVDPYHDRLFVSLLPNHTGGRPSVEGGTVLRPAGMPLQAQGLRRALDRAASRINAARPRSRPLPTMEQLRRIAEG
ncbi:hypothetical protein [Kitasatospora sp. NPDC057015]|uniref:hypothetical protein n=1 Tax=Kitasatospora sp. NPDC057015 TaxID=3346001 RepID=UPI003630A5C4